LAGLTVLVLALALTPSARCGLPQRVVKGGGGQAHDGWHTSDQIVTRERVMRGFIIEQASEATIVEKLILEPSR
jgi:hypothetical protein